MKLNLKDDTSARNWIYGRGGDLWSWLALIPSPFHLHYLPVSLAWRCTGAGRCHCAGVSLSLPEYWSRIKRGGTYRRRRWKGSTGGNIDGMCRRVIFMLQLKMTIDSSCLSRSVSTPFVRAFERLLTSVGPFMCLEMRRLFEAFPATFV